MNGSERLHPADVAFLACLGTLAAASTALSVFAFLGAVGMFIVLTVLAMIVVPCAGAMIYFNRVDKPGRHRTGRTNPLSGPNRRCQDTVDKDLLRGAGGRTGALVSVLLRSALRQLPGNVRERWAEEWADHRTHRTGWRLLWWALCLRATAARTGREYRRASLPLGGR